VKFIAVTVLLAVVACGSGSAMAQFSNPDDAIKYRKSVMFVMQQNFARVRSMTLGSRPFDAVVAAENVAVASFMAKLSWVAFAEGTDKGDTRAKPEIWVDAARFKDYADRTQAEMGKLAIAIRANNMPDIRSAVRAASMACQTCHDAFRKD
jgi:cytochrome c556